MSHGAKKPISTILIAFAVISTVLGLTGFIVLVALGILSSFWVIAPTALVAIGIIAISKFIKVTYDNRVEAIKPEKSALPQQIPKTIQGVTPLVRLHTSPETASTPVISQIKSPSNQSRGQKPLFPTSRQVLQLFSTNSDRVPSLTPELVSSSDNKARATWVHQHCEISFLMYYGFIVDDNSPINTLPEEVRKAPLQGTGRAITTTANQNGKEYEIGIKVFPKFLSGENLKAAKRAIDEMNREYGPGIVECIKITGEKPFSKTKGKSGDHEEIIISQAGIDRIIDVEWQKMEVQKHIRDIFERKKSRFSKEEFAFLMNLRITSCFPRRADSDCYELYSVVTDPSVEDEWSNWLGYIKNTIDESFGWSPSGPDSLCLDIDKAENRPHLTLKLIVKCDVIKEILPRLRMLPTEKPIEEYHNPFSGGILQ